MSLYVVTGGAGFIGSHLVDALLAAGHSVRVVDDLSTGRRENLDQRAELTVGDVADPQTMLAALDGADGCYHLAAIASVVRAQEDWLGTHRTNLGGTISVLQAAIQQRIPVVYASSAAIYGDQGDARMHEGITPQPLSAYGADKLGSELHARVAFGVHGVPTLGLRFFNVYGPRQDPNSPYSGVISVFARRIAAGDSITINGDGRQVRDFVYVGDVVAHLMAGMQRLGHRGEASVFNVCTGSGTTIAGLAALIGQVAGTPVRIAYAPARNGDIRSSTGSASAARLALQVSCTMPLAGGLARLLGADPAPLRMAM